MLVLEKKKRRNNVYVFTTNHFRINRCRFLWTPWMCRLLSVDHVCSPLMLDQAFALYFMLYSPVSSCVSWCFCCDWLFSSQGVEKAHFFISGRNSRLVYSLAVCPFVEIFLSVIDHLCVVARACEERRGEERRGIVCVSVCTSTHLSSPLVKQNPWNAEECRFWTGARSYYKQVSSALCTPYITHGLHFHIKENSAARTLSITDTYRHTLSFTVKTFLMSEIKPCHSSPVH